jgi:hypothetical protein
MNTPPSEKIALIFSEAVEACEGKKSRRSLQLAIQDGRLKSHFKAGILPARS